MEEPREENAEDFRKIKVFSSDDEKLKMLGELLSNKSSRDIIKLLIEKEMYINEIAKKLELRPNLVIHHLQKMESIELLEITNKKITRKGEEHRFFRIPHGMLIIPNGVKESINDRLFKRIFKNNLKFVVIGITSIFSGIISSFISLPKQEHDPSYAIPLIPEVTYFPLTVSLIVIIVGLIVDRIFIIKKKKGRLF